MQQSMLFNAQRPGLSSEELIRSYSEFSRLPDTARDSESSQPMVGIWDDLIKEKEEPDTAAATSALRGEATTSTSATNQEADWVRDFAEQKTLQGYL